MTGSFVVLTRYSQRKLREWQEREVRELLQRTRRNQHFEATERSCNQTILDLSICLKNSITKTLDTGSVVQQLRKGCNEKIACWNTLKSLAITRTAVVIYATTMLVVLVRIELNLIGGLMFKNSQNPETHDNVSETEKKEYLSICSYLISEGVNKLARLIHQKVNEVTSSVSLMDKLTLRDVEQIYWSIVSSVTADTKQDPIRNVTSYVIKKGSYNSANTMVVKMIQETMDLLDSEEVQNLMRTTMQSGFALLIDNISEYFIDTSTRNILSTSSNSLALNSTREKIFVDKGLTNGYMSLNKVTMPMAKIIPIINGQVRDLPQSGDIALDWLQANIANDKFKALGANIYEAFSF
ncbi:peroxisomal biogenesis factor 3 isoform X2 [Venturia canescens]|nr:peroxisomal biogenesis factor 3 isoform X2 [Venturia canescens]